MVEQIAEAINSGQLRPGDRLESERALAEQFDVSRPTVREAMRTLVTAGVVEVRRGRGGGAFLRSGFVPPNLISQGRAMHAHEASGVLIARRMVEPQVAQLAVLYATDGDLDRVASTLAAARDAAGDRDRFLQLDMSFHMDLARATHNSTVVAIVRAIVGRLGVAYDTALRDDESVDFDTVLADHQLVFDAVAARQADAAGSRMIEHLRHLERLWEEQTGRSLHREVPDFLLPVGDLLGERSPERRP